MNASIVLLPGDGIGPEIVDAARCVLETLSEKRGHSFDFVTARIGGEAIDHTGQPLPEETLEACRGADAVLLGAVGGPKWDDPDATVRPEQGLLAIRKGLGLFANLRPVKMYPALLTASPLKGERLAGVDLMVVRELTGGIYFGQPRLREQRDGVDRAVDTMEYTDVEVERVVRLAFKLAQGRRGKVTSVDKANVLETSRLWRSVATRVGARFPDVKLEHQLVDSCAMRLVTDAASFDVVVTGNMFGDILTDEAAVLGGSLGLLPSASLGEGTRGLYEPIHGSAPDIAGKGVANPMGTVLSAAMMLRHSLELERDANALESAVATCVDAGHLTRDLGGTLNTEQVTEAILRALA